MACASISLQAPPVSLVDVVKRTFYDGNRVAENIATVRNCQSQLVGLGGVVGAQHQNVYSLCGRLATEHLPANHGAIFTGEASTAVFTAGSMLGVAKGLHNGEVTACVDNLTNALSVFQAAWRNRLVGTHAIGIDGTKEGEQEYYAYEEVKKCTVALCEAIEEHFSPASSGQHSGEVVDRLRPIATRYFEGVVAPFVQKSAEDTFQFVAKPASNDSQASQDYTQCLNEEMLKQLDGQWSGASSAAASKFELVQKMFAAFAKVPESILSDKTTPEAATSPAPAATNLGSPGMTGNTSPPIHITQNGGNVTQNGASNTNTISGPTSGTSHELHDLYETMRQQLQITGQLVDTARHLLGLSGSGLGASLTSIGNRQDRIVRPRTTGGPDRGGELRLPQGQHDFTLRDLLEETPAPPMQTLRSGPERSDGSDANPRRSFIDGTGFERPTEMSPWREIGPGRWTQEPPTTLVDVPTSDVPRSGHDAELNGQVQQPADAVGRSRRESLASTATWDQLDYRGWGPGDIPDGSATLDNSDTPKSSSQSMIGSTQHDPIEIDFAPLREGPAPGSDTFVNSDNRRSPVMGHGYIPPDLAGTVVSGQYERVRGHWVPVSSEQANISTHPAEFEAAPINKMHSSSRDSGLDDASDQSSVAFWDSDLDDPMDQQVPPYDSQQEVRLAELGDGSELSPVYTDGRGNRRPVAASGFNPNNAFRGVDAQVEPRE